MYIYLYFQNRNNPEKELRRMLVFLKQSENGVKCAIEVDTTKFRRKKAGANVEALAIAKKREEQLKTATWYTDDVRDKDIMSLVMAYNKICPDPVIDPEISIHDRNLKTKYFPA